MILIKRKPRYYSGAVLGYIDNVNVEIWEDEQWKGGMNTSQEEAAITADGAVYFIKRVRYKWYHRKKIEIHNEQNEQIGGINIENSRKASVNIGNNIVAIYKTHKLIHGKLLKAHDGDKFYLQVDKNEVTEIKFLFEPSELKPHKIFGLLPEIKVNLNYSLPTNSLNTLELLCMWYVIEYFRGYEVKRD